MTSTQTRPAARRLLAPLALVIFLLACHGTALAAPSTFTASANKHYWLKDGAPFVAMGFNRYDVWNPNDPANDGLTVTQYVQRMARSGVNVIRVWAEQGDQKPRATTGSNTRPAPTARRSRPASTSCSTPATSTASTS